MGNTPFDVVRAVLAADPDRSTDDAAEAVVVALVAFGLIPDGQGPQPGCRRAAAGPFEAVDGHVQYMLREGRGPAVRYAMSAEQAAAALRGLAAAAVTAATQQADAWRLGVCDRCRNTRLVADRNGTGPCSWCRPGRHPQDYPRAFPFDPVA